MEMRSRQQAQFEHDLRNHFDILSLSRLERLKHYGLHFAKYSGRLARGQQEVKSKQATIIDAFLVCLSAANALNQALSDPPSSFAGRASDLDFIDFAGRFADACEKIDHLEEFRTIALSANGEICVWLLQSASVFSMNLDLMVEERRRQLAARIVYTAS